ncbi:hypothetical protein ABZ707_21470 [Streptomyces sp. NPDC006923]|uniref:hypothetical protein n=1 Tax=Streptomyces sp. NPDC006923 TaxID=3155355 RepID=UPI0033F184C2
MRVSWRSGTASVCLALAVTASGTAGTHAAPATNNAATGGTHVAGVAPPAEERTFVSTTATATSETTLRVVLDAKSHGVPLKLTRAERQRIAAIVRGRPAGGRTAAREFVSGAWQPGSGAGLKKGPGTLRCDRNPSWSDANGTLSARFNCRYGTINWGYKISTRVKSLITGNVNERGVSWWNNGKRKPKNAGHVVGKSYHFHGTLKPVKHDDRVQFQDYMTFRVNIGGRTGTGSLTWAADVRAKK